MSVDVDFHLRVASEAFLTNNNVVCDRNML